jgi:ferredoxin
MTRRRFRLRVDPVACDGYGYCAELLPERIVSDEWGFPLLERSPLPDELLPAARRCVARCPRNAISLEVLAEDGAPGDPRARRVGARAQAGGNPAA